MQRFFAIVFAISVWSEPVVAQDRADAVREGAIEAVIESQMQAFRADDFARAFGFANKSIQDLFGTPERFGAMVQRGYPMVHRPLDVRFLELRLKNGDLWQKVLIQDEAGALHLLDYQMIDTAQGWRIGAVMLLRSPDVGA